MLPLPLFPLLRLILLLLPVKGQHVEPDLCTTKCLCIQDQEHILVCNQVDRLVGLPTNVPVQYHRLLVQNSPFAVPAILRPQNMTGLYHLRYLKVIYCQLEAVEPNTFIGMRNLTYLDLSHNRLKIIAPQTFSGLRLDSLHLMENPGIIIQDGSFQGLRVHEMNLRSNAISRLSSQQFEDLGLQKLFLFNNSLRHLQPSLSRIFSGARGGLIDVTANPLHCDCRLRWFADNLRRQEAASIRYVNITCESPLGLMQRQLVQLSPHELDCVQPRIRALAIDFGLEHTTLSCTSSSNYRDPEIAWTYEEDGRQQLMGKRPSVEHLDQSFLERELSPPAQLQTTFSVNVSLTADSTRSFTCSTWLRDDVSGGSDVNSADPHHVVVQIRVPPLPSRPSSRGAWPPSLVTSGRRKPPAVVDLSTAATDSSGSSSTYLFRKQFTILEMIGAVVGTFTVTIFLLLLAAHFVRAYRYRLLKSTASLKPYHLSGITSGSQHQQHHSNVYPSLHLQGGCGTNNSSNQHDGSTYSQPTSNGDMHYDVPRFCETHTFPPPPSFDHIEFLDFKQPHKGLYPTSPS